ncbi:hypothetical protein CDD81_4850 [Ophiocordyceps australis]|uniref:FMN hydroxy acid dehydrogenase domain-containing protein n=1 Tax=Ophiocordyceps australis TaxID=1399860 RepID=A0A2C5Y944_9HYPO|nr:hypothetical protein CDD81_4850 [Ophiocordyceps australis]
MLIKTLSAVALAPAALAARVFLNEPETGIEDGLKRANLSTDGLPPLASVYGLPDFDYIARQQLPVENYTYYRSGAAGEWSYRNNLEVYRRYRLQPRIMVDISNVNNTLGSTILGHNFSAPFYISPCARADMAHADAELNFVKAAAKENILYMPALYASKTMEEISQAKAEGQVLFQQLYLSGNETEDDELFKQSRDSGAKAIVFTVDAAANPNRHRAARFDVGSAVSEYSAFTWEFYQSVQKRAELPVIIKGITSVQDARQAVENGAPAIILSNHGGRQLDGAPSALEVALDIHQEAPEIFEQTQVFADGGVRYGVDALMLLSLGVKAVGIGRPFMYANMYGEAGVEKAIALMKRELAIDAGNLGVADISKIKDSEIVNWKANNWLG